MRSTHYYQLDLPEQEDKYYGLKEQIIAIHKGHNELYGYRRMHLELHNQGVYRGRKLIQRLMKDMVLNGHQPRKRCYSSHKGELGRIAANLFQQIVTGIPPARESFFP
ncbi:MAG: IS3 family transposase [Sphaerochaetaceae bacterium]